MATSTPILLFDGDCNLCNGFVQFILSQDKKAVFRFCSLQSERGLSLLSEHQVNFIPLSTIVLLENGKLYTQSGAVLRIAHLLGGPWSLLGLFRCLPTPLRDRVYQFVAKHRYQWFGRRDACWLPTPELKARFL